MPLIPESLWDEIYDRSLTGQGYRSIRDWLGTAHKIQCSHVAVMYVVKKVEARREALPRPAPPAEEVPEEDPAPPPLPVVEGPPAEVVRQKSALLRALQRRVRVEVKRSAKTADLDWKRYHSALRLAIQIDGALIRRVEFEERPVLAAQKGAGLPAEEEAASAMSQEERDRMVQEAAVN